MIAIPPDVQIRATLREGSVYRYHEETYDGPKAHYFVVLNPAPDQDSDLVLVHATSETDKAIARTKDHPDTLVLVTPAEYPEFYRQLSAFDCNTAYVKSVGQLIAKLRQGELTLHAQMPLPVVQSLRAGVLASPVVDSQAQALLLPRTE